MKKIFTLSAMLFVSIVSIAQARGDVYIAGYIGASFSSNKTELSDGTLTTTSTQPLKTSFNLQAEFGYFVADNLRLALALGVPFSSSPTSKAGDTWLKTNNVGIKINPNIAYYVKIADRLFYTPEIGGTFEFGSYKEDITTSSNYKANCMEWGIYAHILALEFRVSRKFAIGVSVGTIGYDHAKIKDKSSSSYLGNGQLRFAFNDAGVHARFYL